MPDFIHSLQGRDLGHLRIVAGLWGVELKSPETDAALKELTAALLNLELVAELVEALPAEAKSALAALLETGGKIPWAAFARQFGEIREAGPGRRDREQVHLNPISAAEVLFYRAFLARAFFNTSNGLLEFAYIPEDLQLLIHLEALPEHKQTKKAEPAPAASRFKLPREPLGRPATPIERAELLPASDRILDDACTLLAALRMGWESVPQPDRLSVPEKVLHEILVAAGLTVDRVPQLEPVRVFLADSRKDALDMLARGWRESESCNELRQLPGLACEGEWTNQPLATRKFLLGLLEAIPAGQWWSMNAFVRLIKERYADYQRPAGDYDSWFIRRLSDGVFLRGFPSWDEVDGALVRYLIGGPLFWLGLADLALPEPGLEPSAFRIRSNVEGQKSDLPSLISDESGKLTVVSNGRISVPRSVPRAARYQIARFCDWEEEKEDEYRYRVTPSALTRAGEQGLKVGQLLALLRKYAAAPIPPPAVQAIQRWENKGTEARLETRTILRVSSPEVLDELRKSKAGRFLGESLGPTAVVVNPGAGPKVLAALAELGLLAEGQVEE
jgi:hypothetical protein